MNNSLLSLGKWWVIEVSKKNHYWIVFLVSQLCGFSILHGYHTSINHISQWYFKTFITSILSFSIAIILYKIGKIIMSDYVIIEMRNIELLNEIEDLKFNSEKKDLQIANLEELSIRDPLTNMYNRRYLTEELDRLRKHVIRERKNGRTVSLALLFLDVDDLKKINDSFGHHYGDNALCTIATIITESTRDGDDLTARIGGDEFCIAMLIENCNTTFKVIRKVSRLTMRIIKSLKDAIFFAEAQRVALRITIGLHIVDINELDIMLELKKADEKMNAKKSRKKIGRN